MNLKPLRRRWKRQQARIVRRPRLLVGLVYTAGVLMAILGWLASLGMEESALREAIGTAASNRLHAVEAMLKDRLGTLVIVQGLIENDDSFRRQMFSKLEHLGLLGGAEAPMFIVARDPQSLRWTPAAVSRHAPPASVMQDPELLAGLADGAAPLVTGPLAWPGSERVTIALLPPTRSGFRVVKFQPVGALVEDSLRRLTPFGLSMTLIDLDAPPDRRVLYHHHTRRAIQPASLLTRWQRNRLRTAQSFAAAGRRFLIIFDYAGEVPISLTNHWPWVVLGSGLVVSFLLASYLSSLLNRVGAVRRQVRERTGALRSASRLLRDELWERLRVEGELAEARDRALAAAALKARILANVSHEMRTPLQGILGLSSELLRDTLPAEHRHWIETMRQAGQGLLQLVNDLLDSALLGEGRFKARRQRFRPARLLQSAGDLLHYASHQKGLRLVLHPHPSLPDWIEADPDRIQQVLLNLGTNAIKFTSEGSVTLELGSGCGPAGELLLTGAVQDTGCGIAPGDQQRVFEDFEQLDSSFTRQHGGAGLGLAICRRMVEAMGGTLELESELGRGSTFRFRIPVEPAAPDIPAPVTMQAPARLRVLLAEDNATNRLVLRRLLERSGHRVQVAQDGLEALAQLEAESFDLLLTDIQMPRMDGLELLRVARERWPNLFAAALTAHVGEQAEIDCLHAGARGYLSKPVDAASLENLLRKVTVLESAPR
jgi:signal transduction histidine kinase/CheY-like chemotaxis protein